MENERSMEIQWKMKDRNKTLCRYFCFSLTDLTHLAPNLAGAEYDFPRYELFCMNVRRSGNENICRRKQK